MQFLFFRFMVGFSNIFIVMGIGAIYGTFVDEGFLASNYSLLMVGLPLLIVLMIPSIFLYTQKYIGLLIYGILSIIGGIFAGYYEHMILIRRGFGVWGNFTPGIFIVAGILISGVSIYYYLLSQKYK